jgi:nicotinate-nucleotide adenylyltransferase
MKIGIFGGTFNPIHYGHLRAAEEVRGKADLDKILFIPAGNPPLKTEDIADAAHRYEMVRLAIADNRFFELSDIECRSAGKSYTVNTIEELKRVHSGSDFFFILGIDAFLDLPNWRQPEMLVALTNFVIISRPDFRFSGLVESPYLEINVGDLKDIDNLGAEAYKTKLKSKKDALLLKLTDMDISSTEIRRLIKQDKSIKYLLPPGVQFYIITNGLYRS